MSTFPSKDIIERNKKIVAQKHSRVQKGALYNIKNIRDYNALMDTYKRSDASVEVKDQAIYTLKTMYPQFSGVSRTAAIHNTIAAGAAELNPNELL